MKRKLNQILEKLEAIEEGLQGQLQGGFVSLEYDSVPFNGIYINDNCKKSCINNCQGNNCIAGCNT